MERTGPVSQESPHTGPKETSKKSFGELFSRQEIGYYGSAIIVYFLLGVIFRDRVLNIGVGPLFFIVWIWIVPPLWERLRSNFSERSDR